MKYHEPPEKFKQDFSFFGVYYRGTRGRSMDTLKKSIIKYNATYLFDQGPQWEAEMLATKVNVAPSGNGRNSFRFTE